ncbi:MAG: hypothetical protein EA382_09945 [Spirochaetaceae bacterium]|nr:MAG: hypothetical protein EA382_09945 [Spirochaetaceae bacterium]
MRLTLSLAIAALLFGFFATVSDGDRGRVDLAGSSTMLPIVERTLYRFVDDPSIGRASYTAVGSGAAIARLIAGETDVAASSRPISPRELAAATATGVVPVGVVLGYDAVSIVVSEFNSWALDLSRDETRRALSTAITWSDVRPSFPPHPIVRFVPGTDSGTFDFICEMLFDGNASPMLSATRVQFSEDDYVLARGVAENRGAIGFFGHGYVGRLSDARVRTVAIDGIAPDADTVRYGAYPFVRPLSIYSTADTLALRPDVVALVGAFLLSATEDVVAGGYFAADATTIAAGIAQLAAYHPAASESAEREPRR